MNPSAKPVLELDDDKNLAPVNHDGDVVVKNLINEGRVVQVGGSLTVGGAIEAAQLTVGGPVTVAGGIIGKQKGRYTIGGLLQCRFITGGSLITRSGVQVTGEVVHSRLTCTGRLDVTGVIYGGDIAANGGVTCKSLGQASAVATLIEAGEGRTMRLLTESITPQIDANNRRAAAIRATVGPLLQRMKTLSPEQREKVTELLSEADELEALTANMLAAYDHRKRLIRQQADPKIVVSDVVYAGVTVRLGAIEAMLASPIKGPLTLTTRKGDGPTDIVIVDGTDGSVCVLPSRQADLAVAA